MLDQCNVHREFLTAIYELFRSIQRVDEEKRIARANLLKGRGFFGDHRDIAGQLNEALNDDRVRLAVGNSDRPCRAKLLSFGEIGLAGEVRPVKFGTERIAEAAKQGFTLAIVPAANVPQEKPPGIEIVGVKTLNEALSEVFS